MEVMNEGSADDAIVARDGDEVVLVRVTASISESEHVLPKLDVSEKDAADMRAECLRYLLDHKREDAVCTMWWPWPSRATGRPPNVTS